MYGLLTYLINPIFLHAVEMEFHVSVSRKILVSFMGPVINLKKYVKCTWEILIMKIKHVAVSVGRTVNMGNYESLRASITLEAEIDPDEEVTEVRKFLNIQAAKELDVTVQNMVKMYTS